MILKRIKAESVIYYTALILFFVLHLYRLTAPPNGYHKWRESDTAAVNLNYIQDDLSFSNPRTNELDASPDRVAMELPLYCYAGAKLGRFTGDNHIALHLLSVLAGLGGLVFLFHIVKLLFDRFTASLAVWAMAFSPLYFYYSFKMMPDILMLSLGLAGVYLFLLFIRKKSWPGFALSAVCLAVSACLKPLILSIYLPMFYLVWQKGEKRIWNLIIFALYIILTLLPLAGWIRHSGWLSDRTGAVFDFYHYLDILFLKKIFLQWPFELWVGWLLVPAFIWGLYQLMKNHRSGFFLVWMLASLVAVVLVARYSRHHDYYSLIFIPPLAMITGYGMKRFYTGGKWWRTVAIILIILAPFGAFFRVKDRFGEIETFYTVRSATDKSIPRGDKVIVEDNTRGAVRLYELNRHGWYIRDRNDLSHIERFVSEGAKYIVLEEPLENSEVVLRKYFSDCAVRLGTLYCYPLKEGLLNRSEPKEVVFEK